MNLVGTILVYAGLLASFFGAISLVRPLKFLGIASRSRGVVVFLSGISIILIGSSLPASEKKVAARTTLLDDFVPAFQFAEFHTIRVKASRGHVFAAIRDVTANEVTLFQTLTWMRRFGRRGPESILNAPPDEPLLAVATRSGFLKLAEDPGREIVLGTLVAAPKGARLKKDPTPDDFKALHAPGFALAALNFRMEDAAHGETVLTTETRVYATDASVRKKFGAYWGVIYPGSALIRVMWLRAIRRRAESGNL